MWLPGDCHLEGKADKVQLISQVALSHLFFLQKDIVVYKSQNTQAWQTPTGPVASLTYLTITLLDSKVWSKQSFQTHGVREN